MNDAVTLAHGNGGRLTRALVRDIFAAHLPGLDSVNDAARLPPSGRPLAITTDSFSVAPLEFPGGDIGTLAVCGTVNDLAVAGARPRYLTLAAIIEEGLDLDLLARVAASIGQTAAQCGVAVVTGDTKVVARGEGGGLYLNTTGVGEVQVARELGCHHIAPGDRLLISGPVGDHATAVLLAREDFGLHGAVESDCASILPLAQALWDLPGLRLLRDPTRGGIATACHEIIEQTGFRVALEEAAIPVRAAVRSACELLGFDPLYLACEGRLLVACAPDAAAAALQRLRRLPDGQAAAIIGTVGEGHAELTLTTRIGGERLLDELEDDPLPRIC